MLKVGFAKVFVLLLKLNNFRDYNCVRNVKSPILILDESRALQLDGYELFQYVRVSLLYDYV